MHLRLIFWLPIPITGILLLPIWISRWGLVQDWAPLEIAHGRAWGWGLIALGAGILSWTLFLLFKVGKGTPLPEFTGPAGLTRSLVTVGPYRWARNPQALAIITILAGQALLYQSWAVLAYAAGLWILVHFYVTGIEEKCLAERFGMSYDGYASLVGRWGPKLSTLLGGRAARWVERLVRSAVAAAILIPSLWILIGLFMPPQTYLSALGVLAILMLVPSVIAWAWTGAGRWWLAAGVAVQTTGLYFLFWSLTTRAFAPPTADAPEAAVDRLLMSFGLCWVVAGGAAIFHYALRRLDSSRT